MKYLTYILRNARRNPVRSILTIASMSICLFLMMILLSFFAISDEANCLDADLQPDRVAQRQRLRRHAADRARQARLPSLMASSRRRPFSWIGGKYQDEIMPFAQFARRSRHGLHGHGRADDSR